MITGSHNPPEYNGLKMMVAGETLSGDAIQSLRQRIETGDLAAGAGSYSQADIAEAYFQRITSDVKLERPLKIVVDCGNGVPGAYAPELYRRLGCTRARALLRSRRLVPEPSSRSFAAGESARSDRQRWRTEMKSSAWRSTATATAWVWSPRPARSSIRIAS